MADRLLLETGDRLLLENDDLLQLEQSDPVTGVLTATFGGLTATMSQFNPNTKVTALHAFWADDPSWTNPGDGNPVSSWRNQSGGGDLAASGTDRPTFDAVNSQFNNHAVIDFTAANSEWMSVDIANVSQPLKIISVFRFALTTSAAETLLGFGGSATRRISHGTGVAYQFDLGSTLTLGTSDTSAHVGRWTGDGASSEVWIDEVSLGTGGVGAQQIAVLSAGARNAAGVGSVFMDGEIAFIGIYDGATSDADLTVLANELILYYGIGSVSGTMAAAFGALTGTMTGTVIKSGTMTGALGGLTATMTGARLISGTMVANFGGLTATMIGARVVNGVLVATFGGLDGTIYAVPFSPEATFAVLQQSLWDADLQTNLRLGSLEAADLQPSLWRTDLQP